MAAEYALRGTAAPMGVAEFRITEALPESLQDALPSVEQIQKELTTELEMIGAARSRGWSTSWASRKCSDVRTSFLKAGELSRRQPAIFQLLGH